MDEPELVLRDGIVFDSDLALRPKAQEGLRVPPDDLTLRTESQILVTDLADENALLSERVQSLEADVQVYRDMLQESLAVNQRLTALIERQRETMRRWLDVRR